MNANTLGNLALAAGVGYAGTKAWGYATDKVLEGLGLDKTTRKAPIAKMAYMDMAGYSLPHSSMVDFIGQGGVWQNNASAAGLYGVAASIGAGIGTAVWLHDSGGVGSWTTKPNTPTTAPSRIGRLFTISSKRGRLSAGIPSGKAARERAREYARTLKRDDVFQPRTSVSAADGAPNTPYRTRYRNSLTEQYNQNKRRKRLAHTKIRPKPTRKTNSLGSTRQDIISANLRRSSSRGGMINRPGGDTTIGSPSKSLRANQEKGNVKNIPNRNNPFFKGERLTTLNRNKTGSKKFTRDGRLISATARPNAVKFPLKSEWSGSAKVSTRASLDPNKTYSPKTRRRLRVHKQPSGRSIIKQIPDNVGRAAAASSWLTNIGIGVGIGIKTVNEAVHRLAMSALEANNSMYDAVIDTTKTSVRTKIQSNATSSRVSNFIGQYNQLDVDGSMVMNLHKTKGAGGVFR